MIFYIDTSVWGGYFDKEFEEDTKPFIGQLMDGKFTGIVSNITINEIAPAPENVRGLIASVPEKHLQIVTLTSEQEVLANHYIKEGALTPKYESDAFHIAIATTLRVDSLVSWNFRHMVNFFRIKQYNSINLKFGYPVIDIRTPKEVTYER